MEDNSETGLPSNKIFFLLFSVEKLRIFKTTILNKRTQLVTMGYVAIFSKTVAYFVLAKINFIGLKIAELVLLYKTVK